ncbi:MAG TPA: hypothetical protein VFC04_08790 [Actinomycetota bacterium]|nr:hypothetical protein [Actinomycetota bacterium]
MRWSDEFVGYLAAVAVFAAAVLWATDAPSGVVIAVFAAALLLLGFMLWSWRRTPRVLVVGPRRTEPVDLLEEALDDAGFGVAHCPGPPSRACPVYAGRPCSVQGRPVAAVIVREADSATPVPPCGRALHIPALPVEAGDRTAREAIDDLTAIRNAW